jgi:hypothetical protein
MPLQANVLNVANNAAAAILVYASLHSADPGATGANEISGGSPAYARQLVAWNPSSGQVSSISATLNFDVPASTVAYVGLWSAVTGGIWRGGTPLNASSVFGTQGQYHVTALTVTASSP